MTGTGEPLIKLEGLTKVFYTDEVETHALAGVHLQIERGEYVAIGQLASVDTRNGTVEGKVARIDPSVQNGTVAVDITLTGALPKSARPDMTVDGTIELERLPDVLYVGRPAQGQADSLVSLFKIQEGTNEAIRTKVKLGRNSVSTVEIVEGLKQGDQVVLSDTSAWDAFDRIKVK